MKMRFVITSLFAIMLFAVAANAQTGRIYVATDVGIFVPAASSSSSALPTLNVVAGQPIRIQTGVQKDGQKDEIIVGPGAGGTPHVKSMPIPCEGAPSGVRKAGGSRQENLTIKFADLLVSSTDLAWKKTCRLLTIK